MLSAAETVTRATGRMWALEPQRLPKTSVTMNPSSGSSGMSATTYCMVVLVPSKGAPASP